MEQEEKCFNKNEWARTFFSRLLSSSSTCSGIPDPKDELTWTMFRNCLLWVILDRTLTDGQLFQAMLDGFSTLFSGRDGAGAILMTPAWYYKTLPPIGSHVWRASHVKALFSQKKRTWETDSKAQSSRFRVQIRHMHLVASVVSVVLFCKLLIASPFVHFCGPITSFHPISP